MVLSELNDVFVGDSFYYRDNYLGVIKGISYDKGSDYHTIYFFDNPKSCNVPSSYMRDYYKNKLIEMRIHIMRRNNISKLVHFTKVSNLENIFENGILSRKLLDSSNIDYSFSDPYRLDGKLDYISNSISFPNYKMFYPKRKEDLSVKWAVLSIDSSILIDKFDTEFYRMNAASKDPLKCRFDPCSNDALEDMFYPEDRVPGLQANYTTNPQAEVLVKDIIEPCYIKCIDTEGFNEIAHSVALNSHVYYDDQSNMFTYRKDYLRW